MLFKPILNEALCTGCGLCVSACQCEGIVIVARVVKRVEVADCRYCAECELVCPTGAIQCPYEIVIEESIEITIKE